MDWDRFDADPDPDLAFHFDTYPYPDRTASFTHVGKCNFFPFLHSCARLHCFYLVDVIAVTISLPYFEQIIEIFWKKVGCNFIFG